MNTCRFCNKPEYEQSGYAQLKLVKYNVRHYAHHECYLKAGKTLEGLHDWQIVLFPYRLLKQYGLLAEAEAAQTRLDVERLNEERRR